MHTFALRLAARRMRENPFDQEVTEVGIGILKEEFGLGDGDLVVDEPQCFRLVAISKVLEKFGDPDYAFP